ncbi:hypothetical protein GGP41_001837 [Bipolaris sorokiniana]|uniref:C3H1-type domain-containing protein n=1 Tax=Cochliobolus sativus TaxID=45130 RepID=A0A8H5ZPK0_COCSA|nr:hypothetical protein GGP41_001837 [Bipolaris sorokiniana]
MATQSQNICSLPEDLRCYLLRGNTMVPLIPADQLPFQLKGIPRQLTHRQMSDQGWKLFKETKDAPSVLSVQAPIPNDSPSHCSPDGKPQYLAPDHNVRTESQNTNIALGYSGRLSPQTLAAGTYECLGTPSTTRSERQSSLADAVYHREAQRSGYNNSNPGPEPSKKVYCTHWIATGECRWMHTGCKYKHEMPGTEKLRELGFTRGTPRWWRERNAVSPAKPLTWMQRKVGGRARSQSLEPPAENMPPARSFPDALTFRARRSEDRYAPGSEVVQKPGGGVCKRQGSTEHSPASSIITPLLVAQTPNLIDLDDTPLPPPGPSQSQPSTAESSETCTPHSDASSSSPPTPPFVPRKTPLTKTSRLKIIPVSSSSCPSSSSSSSSYQEDSSDIDTDADTDDAPAAPVATTHRQRRSKRDTSAPNVTSAARRVTRSEAKFSLASSKYAVKMPRVQREVREELDKRKG